MLFFLLFGLFDSLPNNDAIKFRINVIPVSARTGRSFWPIQCIFDYCYKYTSATYDICFVVQGHIYTSKTYLGLHSGSLRAPNKLESPLVKNNIFLSLSLSELHTVHPTIHLRPTDMDGKSLHLRVWLLECRDHCQVIQTVCIAEGAGAGGVWYYIRTHIHYIIEVW